MWEEEIRMSVFTSWKPHRNRRLDVVGSHSVDRRIVGNKWRVTVVNYGTGAFLPLDTFEGIF